MKAHNSLILAIAALLFFGCSGSGVGVKGSTAWYATASKSDIDQYEAEYSGAKNPQNTLYDVGLVGLLFSRTKHKSSGFSGTMPRNSNEYGTVDIESPNILEDYYERERIIKEKRKSSVICRNDPQNAYCW